MAPPARRAAAGLAASAAPPPPQQGHGLSGSGRRRQEASGPQPPAAILCAINGHVLRAPVRSPYGHVYERATIELWLEQQGSVCPMTGQPLAAEDLVADAEVTAGVRAWQVQRSLAATAAAGWYFLVATEQAMRVMRGDGVFMELMWMMMRPSAAGPYLGATALMWVVMMIAMMIMVWVMMLVIIGLGRVVA